MVAFTTNLKKNPIPKHKITKNSAKNLKHSTCTDDKPVFGLLGPVASAKQALALSKKISEHQTFNIYEQYHQSLSYSALHKFSLSILYKSEDFVLSQIERLQQQGLWTYEPKIQPSRPDKSKLSTHWDFVLKEAKLMAIDFHYEKKWKQKAAKLLSESVRDKSSAKNPLTVNLHCGLVIKQCV